MKLFHIADLHLGKRYNELPLITDQKYILEQILSLAKTERPDGILIAGDVYDKPVPPTDAVELFDNFLNSLSADGIPAFIISGNHDSAERLSFGARLMDGGGVHISPVYDGRCVPYTLCDEFGSVNIYCLPFIKPSVVKRFLGEDVCGYTDAVKRAIAAMRIDPAERNVLVAHQFVTGSKNSGSEEIVVGDVGNVDSEVFAPFDYTALGHIHGAQNIKSERIRYAGAPLKYSLAEKDDEKSVTEVYLGKKGELKVTALPLTPLRNVGLIRGTYAAVTAAEYYKDAPFRNDLLHVVLTDENEVPDALAKLRLIYPFVMSLRYDNKRTSQSYEEELAAVSAEESPAKLFSDLYFKQNNSALNEEQRKIIDGIIDKIWRTGE